MVTQSILKSSQLPNLVPHNNSNMFHLTNIPIQWSLKASLQLKRQQELSMACIKRKSSILHLELSPLVFLIVVWISLIDSLRESKPKKEDIALIVINKLKLLKRVDVEKQQLVVVYYCAAVNLLCVVVLLLLMNVKIITIIVRIVHICQKKINIFLVDNRNS